MFSYFSTKKAQDCSHASRLRAYTNLRKLIYDAHTLWLKYREEIETEKSDEDFMAMFEQYPEFENLDDIFIENEEEWTEDIAHYVDDHLDNFAKII